MDHPFGAEHLAVGAVVGVELRGPRQAGVQRGGTAERLLLRLCPVEVAAARVAGRGEVEGGDRVGGLAGQAGGPPGCCARRRLRRRWSGRRRYATAIRRHLRPVRTRSARARAVRPHPARPRAPVPARTSASRPARRPCPPRWIPSGPRGRCTDRPPQWFPSLARCRAVVHSLGDRPAAAPIGAKDSERMRAHRGSMPVQTAEAAGMRPLCGGRTIGWWPAVPPGPGIPGRTAPGAVRPGTVQESSTGGTDHAHR